MHSYFLLEKKSELSSLLNFLDLFRAVVLCAAVGLEFILD